MTSWQKSLQTRSPLVAVQLFDCDQLLRGELTLPGGREVGWVTGYTVISPYHRLLSRHCFMYDHVTMAHIFSSSLVSFPPTYLHISFLMRSLRIQFRNYLLSSISLHYLSWSGPSIAWGLSWHSFVRVRAYRPRTGRRWISISPSQRTPRISTRSIQYAGYSTTLESCPK